MNISFDHYNTILQHPWHGYQAAIEYSCLQRPYSSQGWQIKYPDFALDESSWVIMHCQDYLTVDHQGCVELREIENHFQTLSHRVVVVHWNIDLDLVYQGPLNLVYFPTHTWEILHSLKSQKFEQWRSKPMPKKTRTWQCLNGKTYQHRVDTHRMLKPLSNGIVSLGTDDPLPIMNYDSNYRQNISSPSLNEDNLLALDWLYEYTWINVVTETQYDQWPGIISEKTVFAFLSRQIPIIISYRGMVDHLRKIGFDVFDDVIDHSYDNAPNESRISLAIGSNLHLLTGTPDFSKLVDRLEKQKTWCLYTWPQIMSDHYLNRCEEIKSQARI